MNIVHNIQHHWELKNQSHDKTLVSKSYPWTSPTRPATIAQTDSKISHRKEEGKIRVSRTRSYKRMEARSIDEEVQE